MRYPYSRFPVVEGGRLTGILNRAEIQIALDRGAAPKAGVAYDVRPWQVIREIQNLLIESEDGIVVVTDRENGNPIAVVTLHDLLRAQLAISEREGS